MASYLRPRRGKKSTAESQAIVLKRGEVFFEVPDTGVGTGGGKIKMGDGSTAYSSLPYFTQDLDLNGDDAKIAFTNATTADTDPYSTNATYLTNIAPTNSLKTLFTNLKKLLFNYNSQLTQLNNDIVEVGMVSSEKVISDRKRYIQGYDSLLTNILYELDDTNVTNLSTIHIDDIKVKVGSAFISFPERTIPVSGLVIGTDCYVNAKSDGEIYVSTSDDTSNTITCIGGFHYGRVRISTVVGDVASGVVPNSIWTDKWAPRCKSPNSMVYIGRGLWGDIYLTRCKTTAPSNGIGGTVYESSKYGVLPCTGTEGFNQYTFTEALAKVGKRLSFSEEFVFAAEGAPQGLDNSNNNAWSATSNTARCVCGNVANAISSLNICDLVGNVWKWNADKYELNNGGTSYNWHSIGGDRGQVYGPGTYGLGALFSGGDWGGGSRDGSRCVFVSNWPWNVRVNIGAWAVAESK